jgi:hypothetical protein
MFITGTWSFGPLKKVLTFMATAISTKGDGGATSQEWVWGKVAPVARVHSSSQRVTVPQSE